MDFRKLLEFPESSFPWLPYLWVPQGKTRFKPVSASAAKGEQKTKTAAIFFHLLAFEFLIFILSYPSLPS